MRPAVPSCIKSESGDGGDAKVYADVKYITRSQRYQTRVQCTCTRVVQYTSQARSEAVFARHTSRLVKVGHSSSANEL